MSGFPAPVRRGDPADPLAPRLDAEHLTAAAYMDVEEARKEDAQRANEYVRKFGIVNGDHQGQQYVSPDATAEPSATSVTFHIDEAEYHQAEMEMARMGAVQPVEQSAVPTTTLQYESGNKGLGSVRKSSRRLRGAESSMIDLGHIQDADIRNYLDPAKPHVPGTQLDAWPEEKLNQLLASIGSENFPRVLQQAEMDGLQARAEPLTFSHLTFSDLSGQSRLQDVSGYFVPGEVVGIIAAPDAGASTLLDLLAGVPKQGNLKGEILYARAPPGPTYKHSVGYISQSDNHMPLLSVEETLFFSARLRLPASISDRMIRFRVHTVMSLLQLTHVKDSLVGDESVKGISGGQKRRLSVGVELVAGHSILLGDLVTNGLDSATAFDLLRTFRQMTKAGLSLACTVVQAGPELFQLFHRIIVMSKGSIIYSGPPSLAEAYFRGIGFRRPRAKSVPQFLEELSAEPEAFYKPHLLGSGMSSAASANDGKYSSNQDSTQLDSTQREKVAPLRTQSSQRGQDLASNFRADSKWIDAARTRKFYAQPKYSLKVNDPAVLETSKLNKARVAAWQVLNQAYQSSIWYVDVRQFILEENAGIENGTNGNGHSSPRSPTPANTKTAVAQSQSRWFGTYQSSYYVQLRECLYRQGRNFYRARSTWFYVWVQAFVMAMMLGSIFWQEELDDSSIGVRNRQGLYFYLIAYCAFNSFGILPIIISQRNLFYSQTGGQFYAPWAYWLSFFIVQVVVITVELLLLLIPIWGLSDLAGFPLSGAFWFAYLVLMTASLASRFFILFACYAFPSFIAATTTLTACFYIFALLAGEFIPKYLAPPGWSWAYYISYMYWFLQALVMNDYVDAGVTQTLSGWVVGEDGKWTAWERGLYFAIGFGFFSLVVQTWLSWAQSAMPSAADFMSSTLANHKDEDLVADTDDTINQQELRIGEALKLDEITKQREAYIEFKDLSYWVTLPSGEEKQLLNKVFGFAKPGRLVALIGKSGAGKSTLLDVLSGKKTGGRIEGKILVNGQPKVQSQFSSYAAYVEQFDSFAPLNTVRETVRFSGRLRLSPNLSEEELNKKVDRVLDILNMRQAEHSIVGFPGMGISMELRKKLSIAVEVIAEPVLLFLDEPTTGLDSHSAANVMRTVRSLASSITVICTIHQPPTELVANFQDVLLLEDGGKVVYFGDIETLPTFLNYAGMPKITEGRNVSDYALEVISQRGQPVRGKGQGKEDPEAVHTLESGLKPLSEIFLASKFADPVKVGIERGLLNQEQISKLSRFMGEKRELPGFLIQLRELTVRFWQNSLRDRDSLFVRYFFAVFFGFVVGTVFCRVGVTQTEGPKKLSIIFFTVGHFMFSANSFFPGIFMNRVLYFREHSSNMYSALPYFLARFLGDVPHILAEVFLTTMLVYFVGGLNSDDHSKRYGYFIWANIIIRCAAIFMTVLVASVIAAPDFAFSVLSTIMYLHFALSGFFIPENQIRHWWLWLSDLNFLKYALQFLSITEYRDEEFTCDPFGKDQGSMVQMTQADVDSYDVCRSYATFPTTQPGFVQQKCAYGCGFDMLEAFGVKHTIEWQAESFLILHCFCVAFAFAGFLALKYINHIKR